MRASSQTQRAQQAEGQRIQSVEVSTTENVHVSSAESNLTSSPQGDPSSSQTDSNANAERNTAELLANISRRADAVTAGVNAAKARGNELADRVSELAQRLTELVQKHTEEDQRLDRMLAFDTQRSEEVKRRHEELISDFTEFNNWYAVEPSSWIWRMLQNVGFYLVFAIVVQITALYSKISQLLRNRQRRRPRNARRAALRRQRHETSTSPSPPIRTSRSADAITTDNKTPHTQLSGSDEQRSPVLPLSKKETDALSRRINQKVKSPVPAKRGGVKPSPSAGHIELRSRRKVQEHTQPLEQEPAPSSRRERMSSERKEKTERDERALPDRASSPPRQKTRRRTGKSEQHGNRPGEEADLTAEEESRSLRKEKKPSWTLHSSQDEFVGLTDMSPNDFWGAFSNNPEAAKPSSRNGEASD